jgi:Phage gp6-like head-tail connector protein
MSTELIPLRALTNLERVKTRLNIDNTNSDTLIERLIMGVTDHLESLCNRKFGFATYTNELYSITSANIDMLALKQTPVISLTSLEYRLGTVGSPAWTPYLTDDYELINDGKSGLIRVYGGIYRGSNSIRATYTAGYKIDFANPTDTTKHNLPFDLSDLAERLITKRLKKRDHEGKLNESFDGGTLTWDVFIDASDKEIINRYTRLPSFV